MTTREKIHKLVDELPESEMSTVVEFLASRGEGNSIDQWGILDAQTDRTTAGVMHDLNEDERVELGETIAEAWGYELHGSRHSILRSSTNFVGRSPTQRAAEATSR